MGWLRFLLLVLAARPLALFLTGADVTGRERLPLRGRPSSRPTIAAMSTPCCCWRSFPRAPWPGSGPWRRPTTS
jgi:hypothetical protein